MNTVLVLSGLFGFVTLVLGVLYKGKARKLLAVEQKARELQFKIDAADAQDAIKQLEKKSNESGKTADDLLSNYHKRYDGPTPPWRPGDGGNK